jgi:tRNA pseudouridine55 synthase
MIFAVYKPKGITSAEALRQIKKKTGVKKIGHAGTLDPLARGVLVVGTEADTKKLNQSVQKEKEYLAEIKLGETSETDDAEGIKTVCPMARIPSLPEIEKTIAGFQGEILQRPPLYSAIKISGKEAYKLARRGERPALAERKALIKDIRTLDYHWPILKLKVITGPGVYIRSLARDIGEKLEVGGYLADLERTRVGEFTKEKALALEET